VIDENAAVIEGNDAYTCRQARLNLVIFCLNGIDYLGRLRRSESQPRAHGFSPILVENTRRNSGPSCTLPTLPTVTGMPLKRKRYILNVLQASINPMPRIISSVSPDSTTFAHVVVASLHRETTSLSATL